MKPRQQVTRAAIELLKTFEGYRRHAAQLPDGRWTIGYGHAQTAREGAEVSPADAEALLLYDLIGVAHAVNEAVFTPLTQNQFDALCCFAFNIGLENFRRSAALRRVNEGNLLQAAYAMEMWRRADVDGERIVIDALVRRRAAEKTLFLTPQAGWIAAPSLVLPPKIDLEVEAFAPRERPAEVRASLDGALATAEREGQGTGELTAAQQAAAAVGARLETLLPDAAPEPQAAAQPEALSDEAAPGLAKEAEPEEIAPGLIAEPHEARVEAWAAPTVHAPPAAEPVEADPQPQQTDAAPQPDEPDENEAPAADPNLSLLYGPASGGGFKGWRLMLLGLVGLAVFAGGLFQGLNASGGPQGGLATAALVGWALALAGAVGFGLASYGLLRNLGGDEILDD